MTPAAIETARALVACDGWAWPWETELLGDLPGLYQIMGVGPWQYTDSARIAADDGDPILPDLSDPRVLGWVLWLVRRRRNAPRASLRWCGRMESWACENDEVNGWTHWADTEAEALLMALRAAPGVGR